MKIVVLDGYTENPGDLSWGGLEQLGDVTVYDRTSYTESPLIAERIGDAEIVVMNKTPISRATLDKCPNIKLIAVLATGYNVVDIAYAKEKGIPVCNVPNYGGYSVSQFAIALMLEACLHIGHHNQTVHDGKWQNGNEWCYWDYPLIELAGKTYGLLGCGKIGYHTAEAAKGLGMHVIAYDKYPSQAARDLGVEFVELDDLFARSDVLGLQMPLMEFNTGIIRKENIAKMKDGVTPNVPFFRFFFQTFPVNHKFLGSSLTISQDSCEVNTKITRFLYFWLTKPGKCRTLCLRMSKKVG